MKYKLIERGNPGDTTAPKKWYASPVNSGKIDQKAIAKEIAGRSSVRAGNVAKVIQNFLELLPAHIIDGKIVQLGDFGTFRISFSSDGVATENEFNVNKIKEKKVLFAAGSDFKKGLSDISFERE